MVKSSQDFVSTVTLSDAQKASLIELVPAFEHFLRERGTRREYDPRTSSLQDQETRDIHRSRRGYPEELRSVVCDLGINFNEGGMPHKREFSKVLMVWKRTKVQTEVKTSTEALHLLWSSSSQSTERTCKKRSSPTGVL